jgi:hypothetical protein
MNENIYDGIANGSPVAILVFIIMLVLFIMFAANGFNMGTHEDTGRPVKSFNAPQGKRLQQRRRYNQKKYPGYEAAVASIEVEFDDSGDDFIRDFNYRQLEQNIKMVEAGMYEYNPNNSDSMDMFDFPED